MPQPVSGTLPGSPAQGENSELQNKYLTFWADNQLYGMPIRDIEQIIQMQPIISIPEFPPYAKGIIRLRGEVIPTVDMRLRLGKEEIPYNDHTCIIISSVGRGLMGFIVDGVCEVSDIAPDQIASPPVISGGSSNAYLTGIGRDKDKIALLLDPHKIVGLEQLEAMQNMALSQ